jgi:hypothetical protein
MENRTPAYWPTRILLAVGCIATGIALALTLAILQGPEPMFDSRVAVLGLPTSIVVALVGFVPVLVGFAWMLRIFRGPRDEPPAWRYRDR